MKKRVFALGARYLLAGFAAVLLTVIVFATQDDGPKFSAWSEPVNLGSPPNGPLGEWFNFISKDGLSLYFTTDSCVTPTDTCREGFGGHDIFVCQRACVNDPWGPPQNLGPAINTPYNEGGPSISPDGHFMYFASNRPGGFGGNDIYVSRRHNKRYDFSWRLAQNLGSRHNNRYDFGWQPAQNLGSGVNTGANEASPEIFEDDEGTGNITLYFDSNRTGGFGPFTDDGNGNGNDIYASILQPDETFGPAEFVEELSTTSMDRQPAIRRDGLEIFIVSNRPGGRGSLDLWVSTRPTTSDPWSEPVNLGEPINGSLRDAGPALSWDRTSLYFCSVRPDSGGLYFDLYVSTRTKLKGPHKDKK